MRQNTYLFSCRGAVVGKTGKRSYLEFAEKNMAVTPCMIWGP